MGAAAARQSIRLFRPERKTTLVAVFEPGEVTASNGGSSTSSGGSSSGGGASGGSSPPPSTQKVLLNQNGILSGVGNNTFAPNDLITREQMAQMLYKYMRYKGIELNGEEESAFQDQDTVSAWADEGVSAMRQYGLIGGVGGDRYAPQDTANRASVAQICKNLIESYLAQHN